MANVPLRIKVVTEYGDSLPKVRISRLIVDAFVELIVNAVKAMPDKGRLELTTGLAHGKWVEVRFTDTGCGIAVDMQDRIFELFSVARKEAEGTEGLGFGLWWIKTFLSQQGGDIVLLESEVEKGSTFVVKLPIENNE